MIGKAYYKPDINDGLTGSILATGQSLNIPGGPGARTYNLLGRIWLGKYRRDDPNYPKEYYANRPFLGVPIKSPNNDVLGVIRVPDSVKDKDIFSDNDLAVVEACAAEVARALETAFVGRFFQEIEVIKENCSSIKKEIGYLNKNINLPIQKPIPLFLSMIGLCCFAPITAFGLVALLLILTDTTWSIIIYIIISALSGFFTFLFWRKTQKP
jgi:hypothetical protein